MATYALTGTPATGKTSITAKLKKQVIHLSDFYSESSEEKNKTGEWKIDIDKMNAITQKRLNDGIIVEGHLSHFIDNIDQIIVLRCDPRELRKRMEKRNYSEEKIVENLEAEAMGLIYSQALEIKNETDVFQLDTTSLTVNESSKILGNFIEGNVKLDETIDYSERIMEWY
tara:strand:- start:87 stop:599 length:513 start_codon:yes stop_codon:yes gene_type:complete